MNFILNSTVNVLGSFYIGPVYNQAKAFLTTKPNQSFKDITKGLIFSKLVIPFIASKVNAMSCVQKTIAESGRLIAATSGKAIQWWFSRSVKNLIHNELKMNGSHLIDDSSEQALHSAIMEALNPLIKTNKDKDLKLIVAEIGKEVISQIIQTKASYLIAGRFFNKEVPTIMEIAYPTFLLQVLKSAEAWKPNNVLPEKREKLKHLLANELLKRLQNKTEFSQLKIPMTKILEKISEIIASNPTIDLTALEYTRST